MLAKSDVQKIRLSSGIDLAFRAAGDNSRPGLVLLHGTPNSSYSFRDMLVPLSQSAFVIAPDLPGFGSSDVHPEPTFSAYADCIEELLQRLGVKGRFIYLHDFGAPVGLQLAMRAPQLVRGLIIQNANAHHSGIGPQWGDVKKFWSAPNPENEKAVTGHLTLEGTRDTYIKGVPADIAARIDPGTWTEDWRVMSLPGRMETQRRLLLDYGRYVERFADIAAYLKTHQPPALMVWGRHEIYFEIEEIQSWMEDLPRMEAHILDAGHLLPETHAAEAGALIKAFIDKVTKRP